MEYGNVAVAILDGNVDAYGTLATTPELGDGELMNGAGRRRRTLWSLEWLVLPFFALFGATLASLKAFAVCAAGLWAVVWASLARRVRPAAPAWLVGGLFVAPLPLVARASISATSIFAHLGSSLFHGAALALLAGSGGPVAGLGAGLLCGAGVHQSFSLAPLLPGVAWLAARRGPRTLLGWGLGLSPGLGVAWLFRGAVEGGDLAARITGLPAGGVFRGELLATAASNLRLAVVYGAGFAHVDGESLGLSFAPVGLAFFVATVLALGVGRAPWGERALVEALAISFGGYVLAWLVTGFRLETSYFDGLRYLLPLAPLPALLLLGSRRLAAGALVAQVVGLAALARPAVFPAPWHELVGYEPWVMRSYLQEPLDPSSIAPARLDRWALYAGTSDARRGVPARVESARRHGLSGDGAAAWWRGYGLGQVQEGGGVPGWAPSPGEVSGANHVAVEAFWEGVGMGTARLGCEQRMEVLEPLAARVDAAAALWRGVGRADVACDQHHGPERAEWIREGLLRGWREDWASPQSAPDRSEAWVRALRIY